MSTLNVVFLTLVVVAGLNTFAAFGYWAAKEAVRTRIKTLETRVAFWKLHAESEAAIRRSQETRYLRQIEDIKELYTHYRRDGQSFPSSPSIYLSPEARAERERKV